MLLDLNLIHFQIVFKLHLYNSYFGIVKYYYYIIILDFKIISSLKYFNLIIIYSKKNYYELKLKSSKTEIEITIITIYYFINKRLNII